MIKPTGYSLLRYGDMIADRSRMFPYGQALRAAVRPGSIVVDIGAGAGIFSLLACQLGAGHVHAIEPNDSIGVARDMAAANGFSGRITFHQALSTEVNIPGRADVVISDLRGILPLFQNHIPSIIDARERLLAPGGVMIPRRDTLWAALCSDPEIYRPYAEPWTVNDFGLNMQAGQPLVVNTWRKVGASPEQLVVPPIPWARLDYCTIEQPDVHAELSWKAEHSCTAHGLILWFDAELSDGIGFSCAPGKSKPIYGQAFFPMQAPMDLIEGDHVTVRLAAKLSGGDYVWRWDTSVFGAADSDKPRVAFRQSTFFGFPLVLDRLHRLAAGHVPEPTASCQADWFILSLIDGRANLGEIAEQAKAHFPSHFASWEDALTRAGELAERYSR